MSDDGAPPSPPPPARRKAWTWRPAETPTLADFRAGGKRRRHFLRRALREPIGSLSDLTLNRLFRLLPTDTVSDWGGRLGRILAPRFHKASERRGRANLKRLAPSLDAERIDDLFGRNRENTGRVMAEFAVIGRFLREGRIEPDGLDHLEAAEARGPVVLAGVHTGNWEAIFALLGHRARPTSLIYMPPARETQHGIARETRLKLGIALLPPGRAAVRPALRALERGETVIIFCDEVFEGRIMGPLFGRPVHFEGNLARACRLAALTGAAIVPVHAVRTEGARFGVRFEAPLDGFGADLAADVRRLDEALEAPVRRHLDQWYFLDGRLD